MEWDITLTHLHFDFTVNGDYTFAELLGQNGSSLTSLGD